MWSFLPMTNWLISNFPSIAGFITSFSYVKHKGWTTRRMTLCRANSPFSASRFTICAAWVAAAKLFQSPEQFRAAVQPGTYVDASSTGEHVSTDAAVMDGEPVWWRHTIGKTLEQGMFDHWVILGEVKTRNRKLLWRLATPPPQRLYGLREFRDHRHEDYRSAPTFCRSVARPLRCGLDRRGCRALCKRPLAVSR